MMDDLDIIFITTIGFLDSAMFGLLQPFICPYITELHKNQFHIGIYATFNIIGQLFAEDVKNILIRRYGKMEALYYLMAVSLLTHLGMVIFRCYFAVVLLRSIFFAVNHTQKFCKELIFKKYPPEEHSNYLMLISVIISSGYVLGPPLGGYINKLPNGFYIICLIDSVLILINMHLLLSVHEDFSEEIIEEVRIVSDNIARLKDRHENLKRCNLRYNWDLIAMKLLYTISVSLILQKWTHIIKGFDDSNAVLLGYTGAYQNTAILTFTANIEVIKSTLLKDYKVKMLVKTTLMFLNISLFLLTLAPFYSLYLVMFLPMIVTKSYLHTMWKDIFKSRGSEDLVELNSAISVTGNIAGSLVFGLFCEPPCKLTLFVTIVLPTFLALIIFFCSTERKPDFVINKDE